MLPANPGSEKPAVTMKLLRCGSCWPPDTAVMSVFTSEIPVASDAPSRFTLPMTGLTGTNSLALPESKSTARAKPS